MTDARARASGSDENPLISRKCAEQMPFTPVHTRICKRLCGRLSEKTFGYFENIFLLKLK